MIDDMSEFLIIQLEAPGQSSSRTSTPLLQSARRCLSYIHKT